ncbi:MAG: hypothetical protein FWH49_06315, partial [Clostridiales bacterium]|nr:hypothetical protein [Clostridiales bacterium]
LKLFAKMKKNGEYRSLDRLIRAFPDVEPSTGNPAAAAQTDKRASSKKAKSLPAAGSRPAQPPAEDVSVQVWLEIKQCIYETEPGYTDR